MTQPTTESPVSPDSATEAPPRKPRLRKRIKRQVRKAAIAIGKRVVPFRAAARWLLLVRRTIEYRLICARHPVSDKTIVFDSFMGRSYSDSPRALYLAMCADPRYDDFEIIWAFRRPARYSELPELKRARIVRYRSKEYWVAFARAKYWVVNSISPNHITPRDGQKLIQTWHGTPLKRLGCDLYESGTKNVKFTPSEVHSRYLKEGAKISYLLSPSAYASEKLASAFCLNPRDIPTKIVEEGYPRNDRLLTFDATEPAAIREELGVPAGKKAVLYAPTWRDDQHVSGVGYTFTLPVDFDRLREELGDEYVILFRAHYLVAKNFDFERYEGFVFDVSLVADINDLYIASDVLVTDYSSVFFDYANLRRPMVFYMYDLEEYAGALRGIYLDLSTLPGPIVKTEAELVDAIRTQTAPDAAIDERYDAFCDTYTYLDDGHASERVLARVIETPPTENPEHP